VLGRTGSVDGSGRASAPAEIGAVANALLGFTQDPRGDAAMDLVASLDRLERLQVSPDLQPTVHALLTHGNLVTAALPRINDLVARLQATPIRDRAMELQDMYLDLYGHAAARAGIFRILLYVVAVVLAGYVGYLFLRLRANARSLQARLNLEKMIAETSAQFINLSRARISDEIQDGLVRVARHTGVDRAHITVLGADTSRIKGSYLWLRPGLQTAACRYEDVLSTATHWSLQGYERQGCVHVPRVQSLPEGAEKSHLQECGIRSWLCIPMGHAGKRIGFLTLDMVAAEKFWRDDDIALLRTAGEIFASAIEREQSESEREALEARVHQAERLEAIGTLAGGIAHEFNNILGAILGYCEMGLEVLRKPSAPRRHMEQIMKAGKRAQGIVEQILAFSRRSDRQYRPVAVKPVVTESLDLLAASLPATLTIRPRLAADGAKVLGNATQLQQVVMNLCTNAAQAIAGRGAIDVNLDTIDIAGERSLSHGTLPAGRYIRLAVTDTGPGMDAAVMERIFEPFFTTKGPGRGTGLGLASVHGIVTQHSGALNVRSRPGAGSTFETYFPQTEELAPDDKQTEVAAIPRGQGETVLLVDDETQLVALGEEMLAVLGYEPVGFHNSTAALAAFHADPQRFDFVLTDEVMPEMTGTELAAALHRVRPELPIVLMTGYVGPVRSHRLAAAGIREVLKKPLLSRSLATCLAQHLPAKQVAGHRAP
jgi:signal transduction histidine kinase/ActR/RegA family two-component response regulator